jgi:uncharacterized protein (TIGR03435 family)
MVGGQMMRSIAHGTVAVLMGVTALAQEPKPAGAIAHDAELRFEVASVRESSPGGRGGQRNTGPERLTYERALFRLLLMDAFGVQRDQIRGPGWATADAIDGGALFDVSAIVPAGATKEQVATMLQNLLKDRFKLKVHRDITQSAGLALVVAKDGSMLKPSAGPVLESERAPNKPGPVRFEQQKDGFPNLFPGRNMGGMFTDGSVRLRFRDYPMSDFAQQLSFALGMRIAERTRLTGRYDFTLAFTSDENALQVGTLAMLPLSPGQAAPLSALPTDAQLRSVPIVSSAIEKQLGLKLEASKLGVDMLVIDHVERTPTAN